MEKYEKRKDVTITIALLISVLLLVILLVGNTSINERKNKENYVVTQQDGEKFWYTYQY